MYLRYRVTKYLSYSTHVAQKSELSFRGDLKNFICSGDSRMLVVWRSRAVSGSPLCKVQEMEKRKKGSQERA